MECMRERDKGIPKTYNDVAKWKAGISGHRKGEQHCFANAIE